MSEFVALVRRAWERRSLRAHVALSDCIQTMSQSLERDVVLAAVTQGLRKTLHTEDVTFVMEDKSSPASSKIVIASPLGEGEETTEGKSAVY